MKAPLYDTAPMDTTPGYASFPENPVMVTAVSVEELKERREHKPKQFQDVLFAVAFYVHLILVLLYIFGNLEGASNTHGNIFILATISGVTAATLSSLSLRAMLHNTEKLVQAALIFSVISSLVAGILGFVTGQIWIGVLGIVSFAIGICYTIMVWARIPFAAVTLQTAVTAVQANMGLVVVAYGFCAIGLVWSALWFMGTADAMADDKLPIIFLFFLSFYWVLQVLQNTVHVTVAGTVGTWWFVPSDVTPNKVWSPAVADSLYRATTFSFGSICFGSLLVAFVQALQSLQHYASQNDDLSIVVIVVQCILACIQGIIEYLNRWAYVYCGIYGFSYLEAGKNVVTLFQNKGWTVIMTDDLADNVLFMFAVGIGMVSGIVGLLYGVANPGMFYDLGFGGAAGPGFMIGAMSGYLFSTVLMGVVNSAVNTVIVLFAEAPHEFQMNYPMLSHRMREAWTEAWPGLFR